jgi:hypothetical protein
MAGLDTQGAGCRRRGSQLAQGCVLREPAQSLDIDALEVRADHGGRCDRCPQYWQQAAAI